MFKDWRDWITRDTVFGHPIDDLISYRTPKVVRIQDRLLGGIDLGVKLLLGIFVVFVLMIAQHGYLEYEPVVGVVSAELMGAWHDVNTSSLPYCREGIDCRFMDRHELVRDDLDKKNIYIATFVQEREQVRQCKDEADTCPHSSPFKTVKNARFYTVGVEDMEVVLTHEALAPTFYAKTRQERFRGSSTQIKGNVVSFRDDGKGRVRTVELKKIDPTLGLRMTVSELLEAAGLDLDKPNHHTEEKEPIRRTGVVIEAHIHYSNTYQFLSPASELRYHVEFIPQRFQSSHLASNYQSVGFGDERMMVKRTGVRVEFYQEGMLGRFNLVVFLQTAAAGLFLTTIASWLMSQIVTRFVPLAERYEAAKYEYTENLYNLRESRNMYNDRVIDNTDMEAVENIAQAITSRTGVSQQNKGYQYGAVKSEEMGQRPPPMFPDKQ